MRSSLWRAIIWGSMLLMVACVPSKVTVTSSPAFQPSTIHTLAIFPFQTLSTPQRFLSGTSAAISAPTEIRSQFRLPGSPSNVGRAASSDTIKVPHFAAQRITRMVQGALEHRPGIHLVSSTRVMSLLSSHDSQESSVNWTDTVKQVGSRLEVDAVVIGLVRTYRERVGTKIGATPAAVGFEVHLVDPRSGRIFWTGEYYEEQKPLNEDLVGFVEHKGAFVKAEDLAEYGVHKMMKQLSVGQ